MSNAASSDLDFYKTFAVLAIATVIATRHSGISDHIRHAALSRNTPCANASSILLSGGILIGLAIYLIYTLFG